jgi:hypothetical protein
VESFDFSKTEVMVYVGYSEEMGGMVPGVVRECCLKMTAEGRYLI